MGDVCNNVEVVRYVRIPVSLISQLFLPEYSVQHIISYGIYEAAQDIFKGYSIEDDEQFLKDLLNNYYGGAFSDDNEVKMALDELYEYGLVRFDFKQRGRNSEGEFDPQNEISDLTDYLRSSGDSRLFYEREYLTKVANEWCRVRAVYAKFGITGDPQFTIERHHQLRTLAKGRVFAPVGINFFIRYLGNAKTQKDRIKLALLLGIQSIIGIGKKFAVTTQSLIKCRMFGFNTPKELESALRLKKNKKLKELHDYYTSHRQFDKLRKDLCESQLVKVWMGYGRRTIVATAYEWNDIKNELAERLRKKQGRSVREVARKQRDELSKILNSF